jgi:hypothetical protein
MCFRAAIIGLILGVLSAEVRAEPAHDESHTIFVASVVHLAAPGAEVAINVPVHPGLDPRVLTARVALAPGIPSAQLAVEADGRALGVVTVDRSRDRISIPIEGVAPTNGRLGLTFRATAMPPPVCRAPGSAGTVELSELELLADGSPSPPRTPADFWPPDLTRLDVYVPSKATPDEATAALTLAAFAARRGSGHPVTVQVRGLDPDHPVPAGPADASVRAVTIRSAAGTETRLIEGAAMMGEYWPALLVTAPGPQLLGAVEALVGVSAAPEIRGLRDRWSFEALGHRALQLGATRGTEAHVRFTQADLGGPIAAAGIRLLGSYTAAPRGARLLLFVNGGLVRSVPLSGAGRFDVSSNIPSVLIARDNDVLVRVAGGSTPEGCDPDRESFVLNVDGSSYIQLTPGQKRPVGFERFPQVLLPEFDVSVDDASVEGLATAAQIIAALQQGTRAPLRPRVLSWEAGRTGRRAWLAVARRSDSTRDLALPLKPAPFRILDSDRTELLRFGPQSPFAELAAFTVQGRDALVVTHRDWPEGVTVLGATLGTPRGWLGLSGDLWLVPAAGLPFAVQVSGGGLEVAPLVEPLTPWWRRARQAAFGAASAGLMLFLVVVYPRVVRDGSPLDRSNARSKAVPARRPGRAGLGDNQ